MSYIGIQDTDMSYIGVVPFYGTEYRDTGTHGYRSTGVEDYRGRAIAKEKETTAIATKEKEPTAIAKERGRGVQIQGVKGYRVLEAEISGSYWHNIGIILG